MKRWAFKVLRFFRITDSSDVVSLTNIAFMLILTKIYLTETHSLEDIAALISVLSIYSHKKHIEKKDKLEVLYGRQKEEEK